MIENLSSNVFHIFNRLIDLFGGVIGEVFGAASDLSSNIF